MKSLFFIWTYLLAANPFTIHCPHPKHQHPECLEQNAFLEGESFRLIIPGFRDAYNPSIVKNGDGYTLFFRHDEKIPHQLLKKHVNFMTYVWMVDLNGQFSIVNRPKVLSMESPYCEDPRVIVFRDKWLLFFNEMLPIDPSKRVMRMAVLSPETREVEKIYTLPGAKTSCEKNWTPFVFEGRLFYIYDFRDLSIYEIEFIGRKIKTNLVAIRDTAVEVFQNWIEQYGPIRGGAPLLEVDGKMWAFFHSYFSEKAFDKKGFYNKYYYHPGLLTLNFREKRVQQMLPYPLLYSGAYGTERMRCFNKWIVYPSGALYLPEEDNFLLTMGENDSGIVIVKYAKERLEKMLVACKDD